jgi:hypothetical protein
MTPHVRRKAVIALVAMATVSSSITAASALGTGTYTRITTPSRNFYFHYRDGATNTFPVSGTASADVTTVDVICVYYPPSGTPNATTLASGLTVSGGSFSGTATVTNLVANCRLRAVPTGESLTGYLGAYAGPVMYSWGVVRRLDGGTVYGYVAAGENPAGIGILADAGQCGVNAVVALPSPSLRLNVVTGSCLTTLPSGNLTAGGTSTASAVKVDGHNAYLPFGVHTYLRGTLALTVAQSPLTVTATHASNGDLTVTEKAPLRRCSIADTYPPTAGSCPALVSTGVTFTRTMRWFRNAHQVRVRDGFSSSGGAHTVALQYNGLVQPPSRGTTGYSFPGRPVAFGPGSPNTTVSGFGAGAKTLLVRSDLYANSDETTADTLGFTWSRTPAFRFGPDPKQFALSYTLPVPAHGTAAIGFASSEASLTRAVQPLARAAEKDMMAKPVITSPRNGARVSGTSTTVKGKLVGGANGLPVSVSVNGHHAAITRTSATTATFAVTFRETRGKHRITALAKDAGGNTRSASITITNT